MWRVIVSEAGQADRTGEPVERRAAIKAGVQEKTAQPKARVVLQHEDPWQGNAWVDQWVILTPTCMVAAFGRN